MLYVPSCFVDKMEVATLGAAPAVEKLVLVCRWQHPYKATSSLIT